MGGLWLEAAQRPAETLDSESAGFTLRQVHALQPQTRAVTPPSLTGHTLQNGGCVFCAWGGIAPLFPLGSDGSNDQTDTRQMSRREKPSASRMCARGFRTDVGPAGQRGPLRLPCHLELRRKWGPQPGLGREGGRVAGDGKEQTLGEQRPAGRSGASGRLAGPSLSATLSSCYGSLP